MWAIVDESNYLDGYVLNEEGCSGPDGRCVYRLFDNQLDAAKYALENDVGPNGLIVQVTIERVDGGEIKILG